MSAEDDNILRCPNCGGRDVRRSMRAGLLDDLMQTFQRMPFRCRGCQHRFHRRVALEAGEAAAPAGQKQKAVG